MIFSEIIATDAAGCILAHSVILKSGKIQKGRLLTPQDCQMLADSGIQTVWAARLSDADVEENAAAACIAQALTKAPTIRIGNAATGRCNLYATVSGLCSFDADAVHALNELDEKITLATVGPFSKVRANQLIATIKIIPFAVERHIVEQAARLAQSIRIDVHPFAKLTATLILTRVKDTKTALLEKAAAVTQQRLKRVDADLVSVQHVQHNIDDVSQAIRAATSDLTLIFGDSATSDRADIIPAAIEKTGGSIIRLGMPVDPGNLLCLATHQDSRTILGLPGCARSPKLNGLDWILQRVAASLKISSLDIARMGVGGLLSESPERGTLRTDTDIHPRQERPLKIGALLLAAGRSSRMGGANKLLLESAGNTVVAQVTRILQAADIPDIIAVTGRDSEAVSATLPAIPTVYNAAYADGISTSIHAGLAALPSSWDAVLIVLGDMPSLQPDTIKQICEAANSDCDAVMPMFDGRQGHPVLWKRAAMPLLLQTSGDVGGKAQLAELGDRALKLPVDDPGVLFDIDTLDSWKAFQQKT